MALVDLHTHSTASDGADSPSQLVTRAAGLGLAAIALTDHDTVAGLAEAADAARPLGIELIGGIEISALCPPPPGELHLLGYFIDPASESIGRMHDLLLAARNARNEKILARLAELDVPIGADELAERAGGQIVTRAHMADAMIRRRYVASYDEAFDRYLGVGAAAHFEKARLTFAQAIETIHDAGGLVALAHAVHLRRDEATLERFVGELADAGLDAIEAIHPDHSPDWVRRVQRLAGRFGLAVTGGSDHHGSAVPTRSLGRPRVDGSFLDELERRLARRRAEAAAPCNG